MFYHFFFFFSHDQSQSVTIMFWTDADGVFCWNIFKTGEYVNCNTNAVYTHFRLRRNGDVSDKIFNS